MFVISLSILREGYEDLKRYWADIETNSKKTWKFNPSSWKWEIDVLWRNVCVGDILKIEDEEYFPADMAILCSSN